MFWDRWAAAVFSARSAFAVRDAVAGAAASAVQSAEQEVEAGEPEAAAAMESLVP